MSSKFAYGSAREVQRDLGENHRRPVAVSYIQNVSEAVASIIEAKEENWNYIPPKLEVDISSVAIGLEPDIATRFIWVPLKRHGNILLLDSKTGGQIAHPTALAYSGLLPHIMT